MVHPMLSPGGGYSVQQNDPISYSIRGRNILGRHITLQIYPARRRPTLHTHVLNFPRRRGHARRRRQRPIDIRLRLLLAPQARPRNPIRLDPNALCTRINPKHTTSTATATSSPASTGSRRSAARARAPTARRKKRRKRTLSQAQLLRIPLARHRLLLERTRPQLLQLRDERRPRGRREERHGAVWAGAVRRLQGAEDETARRAEGRVF
jgi:hypothetical protein